MSVVLVIVGLLAGGIIIGQGMIHQSELRKTLLEINQFRTSINAFRTQYDAIPGDFKDAETFWGDVNTAGGTENGDGDKLIEFVNEDGTYEGYRAWQHLAKALLVPGIFSGNTTTGAAIPGVDVPKAEMTGGYAIESDAMGLTDRLVIILGKPVPSSTTILMDGNLRPEDAHDLDLKADDGNPAEGSIRGREGENSATGSCVDITFTPPKYDLTKTLKDCFLGFQL
jgi:hypothetical protein